MITELGRNSYPLNRGTIPNNAISTMPKEEINQEELNVKYSVMPVESMVDEEIIQMVVGRKRSAEDYRKEKKITWDKCWDHYKQIYDTSGKESWQSKTFQPDTTKVVEIITANLHSALLAPAMPVEYQCHVKEYEENINGINKLIKNDWERSKFKVHYTDFLRSLCIVGTAIGKINYELEEDVVMIKERKKAGMVEKMMETLFGQPMKEETETFSPQKVLLKDWSNFEYRDLYKIYPEPYTTDISKKHWIIEESKITNRELVDLANSSDEFYRIKNVTPDLLMSNGESRIEEDPETQARRYALMQSSTSLQYFDPDLPHQLLEYWGPIPIWMIFPEKRNDENSKYQSVNAWIWVIDGLKVVRATLNPYRDGAPPYIKGNYIRVPGDWYGISPAELMLGLQVDKNEYVNTKSDNVNLSLNKIIALLKDKVPSDCWNRLISEPGKLWLFENTDDIRKVMVPVEFPNMIRDIYMSIEECNRAIQEVTAATSATAGVGGGDDQYGGSTFRGQLLNQQSSSQRWMLYARVLESSGLSEAFQKTYQRIYQYKSYESIENILGKESMKTFELMAPEYVERVASVITTGVMTMETKGVKLAQMGEYAKVWQGRPWLKEYDLARKQWIEMGFSDPDSVIFSPEEMKQFNEFKRSMIGVGGGSVQQPQNNTSQGIPGPIGGQPMPPQEPKGPGVGQMDMTGRPMG